MEKPAGEQEEQDDLEIRLRLIGSEEEIAQGLALVDKKYQERVTGWLRGKWPTMQSAPLPMAWVETLLALLKLVRAGKFDADDPIEPWLRTVIKRKAIDIYRADCRADTPAEDLEALAGRVIGPRWDRLTSVEKRELARIVRDAIETLPPKQRIVWRVFSGHFPDTLNMKYLQMAVSELIGEEETLASVMRALQEGRPKVAEAVRKGGYDLDLRDRT